MKKLTPTYHANSIYEIPVDFYHKIGVKNILIDLDNTLASYRLHEADVKAVDYLSALKKQGYHVLIVSNNKGARVASFAKSANVEFRANMRKPLKNKFKRLIIEKNFEKNATILIGDQLLTDVFVANRMSIRCILVEKLVQEDQWTTRINRRLEYPFRRHLMKKQKLINWRKDYATK